MSRATASRRATTETATYLYCLVHAAEAPSLARGPGGLPGAGRARRLDAGGGLWLVVADAPLSRYGSAAIERSLHDIDWVSRCGLAHEAVVEHVRRAGVTIPMKMFTLFISDDRALAHVQEARRTIDRAVRRVAGREEWGIRIQLDVVRARRDLAALVRRETTATASGTAFLLGKKKQREAAGELRRRGREEVQQVYDALARAADDARRRRSTPAETTAYLLLDAAFLVSAGKVKAFRALAARAASRLGPRGFDVTLTGPWPPYNFVADAT